MCKETCHVMVPVIKVIMNMMNMIKVGAGLFEK